MNEELLIEAIRIGYLAGISDTENNCARWCNQGSKEKAEELLSEMKNEGVFIGCTIES